MYGKENVISYTTIVRCIKRALCLILKRIFNNLSKILSEDIKTKCPNYAKFIKLCHQSKVKMIQIDELTIRRGTILKMIWTKRRKSGFVIKTKPENDSQ